MRLALALLLTTVLVGAAAADVRLFRPLTADPRENQLRWRLSSFTEDWRYGTDVGDSTSRGGVLRGDQGVAWEVAAGEVFRWRPLQRLGSWRPPWIRYQLGVPAGLFSDFDSGALLNTDYQFGLSLDALWRGAFDPVRGITGFSHAVVTSRVRVFHRSSHLGDEYLALGHFGRNQVGVTSDDPKFRSPPVKRVDLSYEAVDAIVSVERSPGEGRGTVRAYTGVEFKLRTPRKWRVGGLIPANFTSPVGRLGLEYRSAGDADDPPDGPVTRAFNRLAREPAFETEWIAAVDARIAKPYNFASGDNPDGEAEAWTPYLWTAVPYGREFRHYATSWRAIVGLAISPHASRSPSGAGRRLGPEWIVSLDWYRGYSPSGQFLDQRLRYHPRWYVVPSLTAHF
jgi:hypothetical protein